MNGQQGAGWFMYATGKDTDRSGWKFTSKTSSDWLHIFRNKKGVRQGKRNTGDGTETQTSEAELVQFYDFTLKKTRYNSLHQIKKGLKPIPRSRQERREAHSNINNLAGTGIRSGGWLVIEMQVGRPVGKLRWLQADEKIGQVCEWVVQSADEEKRECLSTSGRRLVGWLNWLSEIIFHGQCSHLLPGLVVQTPLLLCASQSFKNSCWTESSKRPSTQLFVCFAGLNLNFVIS